MSQPSLVDVLAPFDPTNYVALTGAQLLELVSGVTPFTDKGFCVISTDIGGIPQVPDAVTNTKWQNYIWIRQIAGSVAIYAWATTGASRTDPTTGTNILQWTPLAVTGIPNGSITGNMLVDNTVTDIKIANLDASKLIGSLPAAILSTLITNTTIAGGVLTGTYPNPSIGAGQVVSAMIAAATILGSNIAAKTITPTNMLGNGVAKNMLRVQVADSTIVEWFTPSSIVDSASGVITTANALKIPQVATAGAGDSGTWQMQTLAQLFAQASFTYDPGTVPSNGFQIVTSAHGLASTPTFVRGVLACITNNLGYTAGADEIDITSAFIGSGTNQPLFQVGADSVNVYVIQSSTAGTGTIQIHRKDTGVLAALAEADWHIKIYARL